VNSRQLHDSRKPNGTLLDPCISHRGDCKVSSNIMGSFLARRAGGRVSGRGQQALASKVVWLMITVPQVSDAVQHSLLRTPSRTTITHMQAGWGSRTSKTCTLPAENPSLLQNSNQGNGSANGPFCTSTTVPPFLTPDADALLRQWIQARHWLEFGASEGCGHCGASGAPGPPLALQMMSIAVAFGASQNVDVSRRLPHLW
jgi:hypothetical protein